MARKASSKPTDSIANAVASSGWLQRFTLAPLRDTLLPKLLSGELSVAEAAHEKEGRV